MWCVSPLFIHTLLHYSVTLNTVVEIPKLRVFTNHRWPFRSPASTYLRAHFIPGSFLFHFRRAIPSLSPTKADSTECPQSLDFCAQVDAASAISSSPQSITASVLSPRLHLPTKIKSSPNPFHTTSHQTRFYARCMSHRLIAKLSERFLTIQPFCAV